MRTCTLGLWDHGTMALSPIIFPFNPSFLCPAQKSVYTPTHHGSMTPFLLVFCFNLLHVTTSPRLHHFQSAGQATWGPLPPVSVMRRTRPTSATTPRWARTTGSPPWRPARPAVRPTPSVSSGRGARPVPRAPATLRPRGRMSPQV